MTPRIIIPQGLAAAVLAVLTRRSDRWTDGDELVDGQIVAVLDGVKA